MEATQTRRGFLASIPAGAAAVSTLGATGTRAGSHDTWPTDGYDLGNTGHNPGASGPTADVGGEWAHETGDSITASPAIVDERVYVGSSDGTVYALDARTGDSLWEFPTGNSVHSAPAVDDGYVYVGSSDGHCYAIDAGDGDEHWQFETDGPVTSSPTVVTGPDGEARLVFVGSDDGRVYAIDTASGEEVWAEEMGAAVTTTPAFAPSPTDGGGTDEEAVSGMVYVGSDVGTVFALDAASGSLEWAQPTQDAVRSAPAVSEGRVFVGSLDGNVYALDASTGDEEWRFDTGQGVVGSPAVADGTVYVGSRSGTVHAIDTSPGWTEGSHLEDDDRWQFDTGQLPITGSVATDGETVYAGSENGTVVGLTASDGAERWTVDTGGRVRSGPAVVGGGTTGDDSTGDGHGSGATEPGTVFVSAGDTVRALVKGGADIGPGDGDDGGDDFSLEDLSFLLFPASAVLFVVAVVGLFYAAGRTGLLNLIEEKADAYGSDPDSTTSVDGDGPTGAGAARDEPIGGDGDGPSQVWDLVVDDVIARADRTNRTATQNIILTTYLDSDTLDAPLVAHEVESLWDGPVQLRLSQSVVEGTAADSRPLGDNWRVTDGRLIFEQRLEPGTTVRTLVGRPDCPDDRLEELLEPPTITVDAVLDGEPSRRDDSPAE